MRLYLHVERGSPESTGVHKGDSSGDPVTVPRLRSPRPEGRVPGPDRRTGGPMMGSRGVVRQVGGNVNRRR